jgi:polar amino acid transport system substrate-binding protein
MNHLSYSKILMRKFLIGALLLLSSHLALALPSCPKKISVAFYEFGLLFHQGDGIDRAIIDELAKRSRCDFQYSSQARANIWNGIQTGQIMLSVSAIKTPDRTEFAHFSTPYLRLKNVAILPRTIAERYPDPKAFLANPELRWGIVKSYRHGATQDALLAELRQQNRVLEANDSGELFQWLRDGKIHGLFAQATAYNFYFRQLQFSKLPVARDWAPQDRGVEARLVFSKKHFSEAEIKDWDQIIDAMQDDGTIERILNKYLPASEVKRSLISERR